MPDPRQHRGPHPEDARLFHPDATSDLARATTDLSWLLERGYNDRSALAIVGDRYRLRARQRKAVARCACSDQALQRRRELRRSPQELRDHVVAVDGFNVLITLESWLSGAVVLRGRDGALRDMASVHGSYRRVRETTAAMGLLLTAMGRLGVRDVVCWFDQPVSNSGRIAQLFEKMASDNGGSFSATAECLADPDRAIVRAGGVGLSSDRWIIERCHWFDFPCWAIDHQDELSKELSIELPRPWIVDLGGV